MAISDDLNSIRTHLEDDYKALETLGVSVEDRNIENIKDMANQIYAKFPKTEYQEGSNITLSNTLKGKLDFENGKVGYGDTEQNGEPTPTTPIPIEVVTGEQEVVVRGKNEAYVNSSTSPNVSDFAKIEQGKTYTFSMKVNGSLSGVNLRYGETAIKTFYGASGNISHTFVAPITGTLNLNGYGVDNFNGYENIQLEEGSTATTYEPYITPITKQLSLGNIELAKIDNYRDYIYKNNDKWYKHSLINKLSLNSKMTWNSPVMYQYNVSGISPLMIASLNEPTSKCAFLVNIKSTNSDSDFRQYITNNNLDNVYNIHGNQSGIRFWTTNFSTLETFLDWVDSVNLELYVINSATDTEITDTSLINQLEDIYNIMSLNGTTIIEINGNLPMIIKCRALKGN